VTTFGLPWDGFLFYITFLTDVGFDLAATFPKFINIRRGAYITVMLSIACNPWKLVNTATTFLTVLSSYSIFLGPMTGLMISSYFVVLRQKIKVNDLYLGNKESIYWFTYGIDWRAPIAWCAGTAPSLPGFIASVNSNVSVPIGLTHLYYICFLAGFAISASVYCFLHLVFPARRLQDFVVHAPPAKVLMEEYRSACDAADTRIGEVVEDEPLGVEIEVDAGKKTTARVDSVDEQSLF